MKIGLLWHSLRHPNLGVDALTRANLSILTDAARRAGVDAEFILLGQVFLPGRDPEFPKVEIGGAPALKQVLRGKSSFWKDIKRCDIVFDIGEGDSFTDIYGPRRYLQQMLSKILVQARGVPLVLSPQTIGPFDKWWTKAPAAAVMKRCRKVFARDHLSTEALIKLGVTKNIGEFIDVAFRLPYTKQKRPEGGPVRVGLNVSALLYNGGYSGANELGLTLDYATLTRRLIEMFKERGDVEIILLPHVLSLKKAEEAPAPADASATEDDRLVSLQLAAQYPGLTVAPQFMTSTEAKSYISGLDFLIAGRMHACIGALSAGVPVVPLSYSRKFIGLFGGLGYNRLVDARKATTDEAFAFIRKAFDERAAMKLEAEAGAKKALARLELYETEAAALLSR